MDTKSVTYICPNSITCSIHKNCHVLTTKHELQQEIEVMKKCVAAGKNVDGTTKEIVICIGKVE